MRIPTTLDYRLAFCACIGACGPINLPISYGDPTEKIGTTTPPVWADNNINALHWTAAGDFLAFVNNDSVPVSSGNVQTQDITAPIGSRITVSFDYEKFRDCAESFASVLDDGASITGSNLEITGTGTYNFSFISDGSNYRLRLSFESCFENFDPVFSFNNISVQCEIANQYTDQDGNVLPITVNGDVAEIDVDFSGPTIVIDENGDEVYRTVEFCEIDETCASDFVKVEVSDCDGENCFYLKGSKPVPLTISPNLNEFVGSNGILSITGKNVLQFGYEFALDYCCPALIEWVSEVLIQDNLRINGEGFVLTGANIEGSFMSINVKKSKVIDKGCCDC